MDSLIKEFCEENGLEYRSDYSGRCMYGKLCVGIVCHNPLIVLMDLCQYIVDYADDYSDVNLPDLLGQPYTDAMGMESILYFPLVRKED